MLSLLALLVTQVHAVPCAAHVEGNQVVPTEPITFVNGSAELTPESAGPVQGIACLLQEQPELSLQIEVHSDTRGSSPHNLHFSAVRANTLRQALINAGIGYERLVSVGRGETMPVEHADWAQSQALSRRIEFWTDASDRPPPPTEEAPPEPEYLHEPRIDPASEPEPVKPRPAPSLCERLAGAQPPAAPQLPGALSCEPSTTGWACYFSERPATLTPRMQACVGGQRDGDELYTDWRGGTLSVRRDPDRPAQAVVSWIPHIR
jgi:hypothetical protein